MSDAVDNRFSRVVQDPRFKKIPRVERQVKIDARFEKMFTDRSFHTKFSRDKRGKRLDGNKVEDLDKFYELKHKEDERSDTGGDYPSAEHEVAGNDNEAEGVTEESNQATSPKAPGKEDTSSADGSNLKNQRKRKLLANISARNTILSSAKRNRRKNKARSNIKKIVSSKGDLKSSSKTTGTSKSINFQDIRGVTLSDGYESSSSDEDSDLDDFDDGADQIIHDWGNIEENVKCIENAETSRLAVCNCDWDRIGADDLYMLFTSFVPPEGEVISVKVYASEFGKQRMEEEKISGPKELVKTDSTVEIVSVQDDSGMEENMKEEGSGYDMEKLREYQMNRLKYYYAVVECNDVETANKLYEELDGHEYERSATRLDLRFIPDNTTFDDKPSSMASAATVMVNSYEPVAFHNTALQQSTVRLTWDEMDPKRVKATMRKFDKDTIDHMDFNDYLASASSDEGGDECNRSTGKEKIDAYKQLLQEIDLKEAKNNEEEVMHVSFPQKEDNTDTNQISTLTLKNSSFYKDEKNENEGEIASKIEMVTSDEEDIDSEHEGDNSDENSADDEQTGVANNAENGFDDPFFNEIAAVPVKSSKKDKKAKRGKKKSQYANGDENLTEEERKKKKELELLILDEEDDKKHFHLKEILQNEKSQKTKRKRNKMISINGNVEDDFKLDVADPRFSALYSSHLYSIDPSDPNFRRTKAAQEIIDESQKRRTIKMNVDQTKTLSVAKKSMVDPKLLDMINSVKSKTALHTFKKAKSREQVKK